MNTESLQRISDRRNSWIAAINTSDVDGFMAVLTEDAVWLPWGQTAIHGANQIQQWLAGPFAEYNYEYKVTNERVRIAGDWAIEFADFETRATKHDGMAAPVHVGKYIILWRWAEQTGWLIERYIDGSGFEFE